MLLVDTSFLISLADPGRKHHAVAVQCLREALRRGMPVYLSAIVASEFGVRQAVTDLPLRNFVILPFNIDHAIQAGLLMRALLAQGGRDPTDRRDVVKEDVKLIAQAICESITHIVTEDRQTLARYAQRLTDSGTAAVKCLLLADGFDDTWFDGGQRSLLTGD